MTDRVRGQLLQYDLKSDIGLVTFRPNGPVAVSQVADHFGERVNDRVWSVGCDRGADPTIRDSHITALDRYHGPPNIEAAGAPVQGRSGGGLFNREGKLVGICFAADNEGDEGLYSALASVHAELDKLGFQDIYRGGPTTPAQPAALAANPPLSRGMATLPERENPIVRGQGLSDSEFPTQTPAMPALNNTIGNPSTIAPATLPASNTLDIARNLPPREQAGLQEIAKRAVDSEVVLVVHPRDGSGDSEVIQLGRVSPELLQALKSLQAR